VDEPHCSAEYRRHAVAVVVARALDAAVQDVARSLVAA
jgi:CO/xanthine dehydrogenase FAD-binding subunit